MTELLIYQGKAALALVAFYIFYRLLLSKETFHRFNRSVLLGTAAMAFVLPLCVITISKTVILPAVSPVDTVVETVEGVITGTASVPQEPIWPAILLGIFVVGALAVMLMTVISIIKVRSIIRSGEHQTLDSGETLVITENGTAPFSWMKYIVLSREDYEIGYSQILTHEKAHIALRHSWDLLFVDLITVLQWFNPVIWMLKSDLRALHEFEADDAVLRSGANIKEYQYLLIKKAVSKSGYSVANSFNHSTLKARITMMLNKKSSRMSAWKALYVLPLVGISLAATAETKVDYQYEGQQPEAVVDTLGNKGNENWHKVSSGEPTSFRKKNLHDGKIITDIENNMLTVIFYNVDGIECKTQFIDINPNEDIYIHNGVYANEAIFNKVAAEDPEAVIMVGYLKNDKKVRVVVTPSEVYVTGIVILREQKEDDPIKVNVRDAEGKEVPVDPSKLLFVVDGKPRPEGYSMNQIDPHTIESVKILKAKEAQDKYGKYAENKDVIEISTKPIRFIPVSEPVGNLEEYEKFKLYSESCHGKKITYVDYLKIPSDKIGYLFVEKRNDTKYLHVYTTDYNTKVHLSKCKKTKDINDENLSWVNENTQILIDGKWNNFEGYLRALKFQSDKILEIEYHKYSDKKVKKLNLADNGFVSVIFKKEYANKITLVM